MKVIEAQEELNKGKTLDSGLNSGNQIVFTEKWSFRNRNTNNTQSVNHNENLLQICDKGFWHIRHFC